MPPAPPKGDLIQERHHVLKSADGFFLNNNIVVYCPEHDKTHSTTIKNYKKAKTGMNCCGKVIQDAKRVYSHLNDAKEKKRLKELDNDT